MTFAAARKLCFQIVGITALCVVCFVPELILLAQSRTAIEPRVDREFTPAAECPPSGMTVDGEVVRVIDGDTLVIEWTESAHVRLRDCWTPESRTTNLEEKQRGLKAKARLLELAPAGQRVRLHVAVDDGDWSDAMTLNRYLGRAWVIDETGRPSPEDLSAIMVREGFATTTKPARPEKEDAP